MKTSLISLQFPDTDILRNNQLSNLPRIFQIVFDYMNHTGDSIGISLFGQLKHFRSPQTREKRGCVIHQLIFNTMWTYQGGLVRWFSNFVGSTSILEFSKTDRRSIFKANNQGAIGLSYRYFCWPWMLSSWSWVCSSMRRCRLSFWSRSCFWSPSNLAYILGTSAQWWLWISVLGSRRPLRNFAVYRNQYRQGSDTDQWLSFTEVSLSR